MVAPQPGTRDSLFGSHGAPASHVIILWLVVWNEFYDFPILPIILGISSSQLTSCPSFFRGVGEKPPTSPGFGWLVPDFLKHQQVEE